MDNAYVIKILLRARPYVQAARDTAEAKHDAYGEDYMCAAQWEIMNNADATMQNIDDLVNALRAEYDVRGSE